MRQAIPTITAMLMLFLALGVSGCDQAKDLASKTVEKAKDDVIAEITKTLKGGEQAEKGEAKSSKETDNWSLEFHSISAINQGIGR